MGKVDDLALKLTRVYVPAHPRIGRDGKIQHVDAYWYDNGQLSFQKDPAPRLTALAGAWDDWQKTKPWEKSAANLNDPRLVLPGYDMGSKSATGGSIGAIAATWRGEHVNINPVAWDGATDSETRRFLLAHEISHAAAAYVMNYTDQAERDKLLAPFKSTNGGYSEGALYEKDDRWALTPEEMLSDVGATILIYGENVLRDRYEKEFEFDIAPSEPDPHLTALYATVAEALKRVGQL